MGILDDPKILPVVRDAPAVIAQTRHRAHQRPRVCGKFLFLGDEKFYLKGVTYGPFDPDKPGGEYGKIDQVHHDFRAMAEAGFNTVRLYTMPPRWLLDLAQDHGLRIIVGLAWEQHITFLDTRKQRRRIEQRVRDAVRQGDRHPAILCYTIGNEIPPSIVRWYGRRRVERFLERLFRIVKQEDPEALVTYVNYPTTEYLQLPFLDFDCFNVYLESQDKLRAYLARLQNQAGDRPLVMAEIGLDSLRNGADRQAEVLDWQVRASFAAGCAGVCLFSWTDEWHRGGQEITDWAFGLTDRQRQPKPALRAVAEALSEAPFPADRSWPRISILVCTYNGSATIRQTLASLRHLEYPDYEVIVVNDGSTDRTAEVIAEFDYRVITTDNRGLSNARNLAMEAATGQIVAYLDDDAYPDPHWLMYLAATFMEGGYVAVGGPNLPPPGDGFVADCVAHAPGGPNHVLLSDTVAEHIPGCNMAILKSALEAIGGFDPQFRIAGDDVDVCWRLQERDGVLGFCPAAVVWHHRRNQMQAFYRQQLNYGRAEAMLEIKWPQKYNHLGHVPWAGRMYGPVISSWLKRWRIYHGVWGTGLFQCMYTRPVSTWRSLPLMPEWYLIIVALILVAIPGALWRPLLFAMPLLALAIGVPVVEAAIHAWGAPVRMAGRQRLKARAVIAYMHLVQPLMRLKGRLFSGLTPWRRPKSRQVVWPVVRRRNVWSQSWQPVERRLADLESAFYRLGARVIRGGPCDRWDLEVHGGILGRARVLMAIEEHGQGRQMIRLSSRPTVSWPGLLLMVMFGSIAMIAAVNGSLGAAVVLGMVAACLALRALGDCMAATASYLEVIDGGVEKQP